jgi:hypothetical protein
MGTPFSSLICSHSHVGSSTNIIESSAVFFFFNDIIYSCNFALPVVFPEPMFPSIETIKQSDVAGGGADADNFVVHADNEAEAPIFKLV